MARIAVLIRVFRRDLGHVILVDAIVTISSASGPIVGSVSSRRHRLGDIHLSPNLDMSFVPVVHATGIRPSAFFCGVFRLTGKPDDNETAQRIV